MTTTHSINSTRIEDEKVIIRRIEEIIELLLFSTAFYFMCLHFYSDIVLGIRVYGRVAEVLLYGILCFLVIHINEGFRFGYMRFQEILTSQNIAMLIVNSISYILLCLVSVSVLNVVPFLILMVVEFVISYVCVYFSTRFYHQFHVPFNMLMIYGAENYNDLKIKVDGRPDKYRITKIVPATLPFEELTAMIPEFDAVLISDIPAEPRNNLLKWCYTNSIRTYLTPKISDVIEAGSQDIYLFDTPLKLVKGLGLSIGDRIAKRTFDLIVSCLAFIVLSPIFLIVAIAIKLEDGGPAFYMQERVTQGGRRFMIYKFRSMIVNAEKNGEVIPATDHDSRITKVGRIIRACRVDELPQLINIINGDMSIVGPRPERVEHVEKYTEMIPEFQLRTKVKGGLTGMAQIYGKYNTSPLNKLKFDLMYIENYNFMLDLKLIIMTIRILFQKESTEGFDQTASMLMHDSVANSNK